MLSAFAPNVQFLIFSYGIVVGEYPAAASLILYSSHIGPDSSLLPWPNKGKTPPVETLLSFPHRINRI